MCLRFTLITLPNTAKVSDQFQCWRSGCCKNNPFEITVARAEGNRQHAVRIQTKRQQSTNKKKVQMHARNDCHLSCSVNRPSRRKCKQLSLSSFLFRFEAARLNSSATPSYWQQFYAMSSCFFPLKIQSY